MATSSPDLPKSEAQAESDRGYDPRIGANGYLKDDVGDLTFEEYTAGGLGRHLGVFSTTSLM